MKEKVEKYLEDKLKEPPSKLSIEPTAFMPEKIAHMKLDDLLHVFMDDNRIKRVGA